jgi:hypothetical protein
MLPLLVSPLRGIIFVTLPPLLVLLYSPIVPAIGKVGKHLHVGLIPESVPAACGIRSCTLTKRGEALKV